MQRGDSALNTLDGDVCSMLEMTSPDAATWCRFDHPHGEVMSQMFGAASRYISQSKLDKAAADMTRYAQAFPEAQAQALFRSLAFDSELDPQTAGVPTNPDLLRRVGTLARDYDNELVLKFCQVAA